MRKEGLIAYLDREIKWLLVVSFAGFVLLLSGCGDSKEPIDKNANTKEKTYGSNGEQIYFSRSSVRGTKIIAEGMSLNDNVTCAGCHGPDGKGGSIRMTGEEIKATDIRYKSLTSKEHIHGQSAAAHFHARAHPPYNDESIKHAISRGLDPGGNRLNSVMPRWQMSGEDLTDLINFLKTLE